MHVIGESGYRIDAFADVAPGCAGANGEACGQAA